MSPNDELMRTFIDAIHSKQKLRIEFFSKEDQAILKRICAPMDVGPRKRAADKSDCFHVWDYDSDESPHPLSLHPTQVRAIVCLDATFSPDEFVTWPTSWFVKRAWGKFS